MSDRELGALGVEGLDVPGGEPRLGVGLECGRHAPVLLGECVEGVRIGVAVDEDYGLLGMLHQRHQELERVKDLALEEDLLPRCLVGLHVVEDSLEALVFWYSSCLTSIAFMRSNIWALLARYRRISTAFR